MNEESGEKRVTVSVVSHRQGELIVGLLRNLAMCSEVNQLILTYNVPENEIILPESLVGRVLLLRNSSPIGFGANHNAAFRHCDNPFFCVLNPDIRMPENPFPRLLDCLTDEKVALSAPVVLNPEGGVEDSARQYPTLSNLLLKSLGWSDDRYMFPPETQLLRPDWLAGMFLLFRSKHFAAADGFDERFHMYYEDVDLCARLKKMGLDLLLCPPANVIHDAQRTSHRNPHYMFWHARSMIRYFIKHIGRLPSGEARLTP